MDKRYLISHWGSVRNGLNATLDKFTDEDLDFKPFPDAMSVRELVLHIAHEESGEFHLGIVQDVQTFPEADRVQDYPSMGGIRSRLESVHDETMAFVRTLKAAELERVIPTPWGESSRLIELLGHILEHEIHHRGELSLILGILGRTGLDA